MGAAEELDALGHVPPNGEQSVERSRRLALRNLILGVAAVTLLVAVLLRLPASEREGAVSGRVGPEPTTVEMTRATPAQLGLSWHTPSLPTSSRGALPRHFPQLVPPGTPPVYRGRVLILIPGSPGSPEVLALETRWYFEVLAREREAVTVYAKAMRISIASSSTSRGAASSVVATSSGSWARSWRCRWPPIIWSATRASRR